MKWDSASVHVHISLSALYTAIRILDDLPILPSVVYVLKLIAPFSTSHKHSKK